MRTLAQRYRFDAIEAHYASLVDALASTSADRWATDPYAWHGVVEMTPIEAALWGDLRCEGVVMYPQFPVGGVFVDFANPQARVAIECDGREWHLDKAKDAERDEKLNAMGWTVYRISGSDCKRSDWYEEDEYGVERVRVCPARQLIRRIAEKHQISLGARSA